MLVGRVLPWEPHQEHVLLLGGEGMQEIIIEKSATMPADLLAWARMPTGGQNANEGLTCHRA